MAAPLVAPAIPCSEIRRRVLVTRTEKGLVRKIGTLNAFFALPEGVSDFCGAFLH